MLTRAQPIGSKSAVYQDLLQDAGPAFVKYAGSLLRAQLGGSSQTLNVIKKPEHSSSGPFSHVATVPAERAKVCFSPPAVMVRSLPR